MFKSSVNYNYIIIIYYNLYYYKWVEETVTSRMQSTMKILWTNQRTMKMKMMLCLNSTWEQRLKRLAKKSKLPQRRKKPQPNLKKSSEPWRTAWRNTNKLSSSTLVVLFSLFITSLLFNQTYMQFINQNYRLPLLLKWRTNVQMVCQNGIRQIVLHWEQRRTPEHGRDKNGNMENGTEKVLI